MPVPTTMADLSTTAASNSPAGGDAPSGGDDMLRAIQAIMRTTNAKGADIASATTTDIGAATGEFVDVTGTTTITGLGTIAAGIRRVVRFTGALTLTHNATSLILPGAANITTANGDVAMFRSLAAGNWVCESYVKASGAPINGANFKADGTVPMTGLLTENDGADIASATTVDLTAATGNTVVITGTTATTALTMTAGQQMTLIASGAWPLTHHATNLNINGGASYTCAAGDRLYAFKDNAGTVRVNVITQAGTPMMTAASQAEMEAGTESALRLMSPLRVAQAIAALGGGGVTIGTEVSLSGATIDITGLTGAKMIVITLNAASMSGTDDLLIQIGDAGGIEATGYSAGHCAVTNAAATGGANYTTGFGILTNSAASVLHGTIILALEDEANFTWSCSQSIGFSSGASAGIGGGSKSLSAALTQLRFAATGADTYDAGSANVLVFF